MSYQQVIRAIIYCVVSILSGVCFAQNAAGHKTYSGPFPDSRSHGKATYSYLTSEIGERIFDGHFNYIYNYFCGNESLEGNFKNNRQIGKWIKIIPHNSSDSRTPIKTIMTANFGENGYLNGSFKIQEFYHNGTIIDVLDATYRNGKLNGPFKGKVTEGVFFGQYKNGVPTGIWEYSWLESPVDFNKMDEYGRVMVKHTNSATGDILEEYKSMPTYPDDKSREIGWWTRDILMRDSRKIVFHPSFPPKEYSLTNDCFVGARDAGFEQTVSEPYSYLLQITIPTDLLNDKDLRGYWSDWDDFVLRNYELDINEIGNSPVTINLLLDVDRDGNVVVLEKDNNVSDILNNETLRLLKKSQWTLSVNSDSGYSIEKKAKQGMSAYCNVEVTFNPAKMKKNLEIFNANKQKEQQKIEAAKQYEESFAPIADKIESDLVSNETEDDDQIYDNLECHNFRVVKWDCCNF